MKPADLFWGAKQYLTFGLPSRLIRSSVGVGDELMSAAVVRQSLTRPDKSIWFITRYQDFLQQAELPFRVSVWDNRLFRLVEGLGRPVLDLCYDDTKAGGEIHHMVAIARRFGLPGSVQIKPEYRLPPALQTQGRLAPRQIVIQSATLGQMPMSTKQWPAERMQQVVDALHRHGQFEIIQLGTPEEPAITGTRDLRGKTKLWEAAAVLSQSRVFIGMVSGLMHLARAVDCPGVIICGGREPPSRACYSANINLTGKVECSPCYLRDGCPSDLRCLKEVTPDQVVAAALRQIELADRPLPSDTVPMD